MWSTECQFCGVSMRLAEHPGNRSVQCPRCHGMFLPQVRAVQSSATPGSPPAGLAPVPTNPNWQPARSQPEPAQLIGLTSPPPQSSRPAAKGSQPPWAWVLGGTMAAVVFLVGVWFYASSKRPAQLVQTPPASTDTIETTLDGESNARATPSTAGPEPAIDQTSSVISIFQRSLWDEPSVHYVATNLQGDCILTCCVVEGAPTFQSRFDLWDASGLERATTTTREACATISAVGGDGARALFYGAVQDEKTNFVHWNVGSSMPMTVTPKLGVLLFPQPVFDATGRYAYLSNGDSGRPHMLMSTEEPVTLEPIPPIDNQLVMGLAFTGRSDLQFRATIQTEGPNQLTVHRVESGSVVEKRTVAFEGNKVNLVASLDGRFLAAEGASKIWVWDWTDPDTVTLIYPASRRLEVFLAQNLVISPNGDWLAFRREALSNYKNGLCCVNLRTKTLRLIEGEFTQLAAASDALLAIEVPVGTSRRGRVSDPVPPVWKLRRFDPLSDGEVWQAENAISTVADL